MRDSRVRDSRDRLPMKPARTPPPSSRRSHSLSLSDPPRPNSPTLNLDAKREEETIVSTHRVFSSPNSNIREKDSPCLIPTALTSPLEAPTQTHTQTQTKHKQNNPIAKILHSFKQVSSGQTQNQTPDAELQQTDGTQSPLDDAIGMHRVSSLTSSKGSDFNIDSGREEGTKPTRSISRNFTADTYEATQSRAKEEKRKRNLTTLELLDRIRRGQGVRWRKRWRSSSSSTTLPQKHDAESQRRSSTGSKADALNETSYTGLDSEKLGPYEREASQYESFQFEEEESKVHLAYRSMVPESTALKGIFVSAILIILVGGLLGSISAAVTLNTIFQKFRTLCFLRP